MIFDDYIIKWKNCARLKAGEGWIICQDQVIRDHIFPHLSGLQMKEINAENISEILNASREKGHSPNQQKKIYNVLSKIFNDAINFFAVIELSPIKKHYHKPVTYEVEQPSLSPEQYAIVLEYVMWRPVFGIPCWIQLLAGIRVSEMQALEWKDVDWENGVIYIRKAYNKHTKKTQPYPKGKKQYMAFITPKLRKFLYPLRREEGLICANSTGGILSSKTYDNFIKRMARALKLPITSSHGFRHSCARLYASLEASDEDIQILLGHKNLSSTKTYIHRVNKRLREISKKIS